jgi:hypothetical protein
MNSETHSFEQISDSEQCVSDILQLFLDSIMEEKINRHFIQVSIMTHIANYSIHVLNKMFQDKLTIC